MISVLVPYRPDGAYRDRSWVWLKQRWERMPGIDLIVASDDGGSNPGHFNHSLAINRAAENATGDVYVIADADTSFHPEWVHEAASLVRDGAAAWVLPKSYKKLSEQATEDVLNGPVDATMTGVVEWEDEGSGGLVVVPRPAFWAVGGYDERFTWWGADDVCFKIAMDWMWGECSRLDGAAWHFWHPAHESGTYEHPEHDRQHVLMQEYVDAAGDRTAVQAVRFGL